MSAASGRAALATMMTLATMFDNGHGTRRYKPIAWDNNSRSRHKTDEEKENRKQKRKKISARKKRRGY